MNFDKWLKQAKANTKIIERIESIKYAHDTGQGISWDDLAYLQSQQDFIKRISTDEIELWQLAGIDENEWNNRGHNAEQNEHKDNI